MTLVVAICARVGSAQAEPVEGWITITRANGATTGSSAAAQFARAPVWGAVITSDGPTLLTAA